ncbi:unnamed protein product [Lampetra fluviatilis]
MFLLSDDGDDENNDDDGGGGGDKGHVMTQDLGSPSPRDPVQLHPLDSDSYARVAPVAAASAGQHASEGCPSLEVRFYPKQAQTSSEHRGGPALRRSRQREDQRSGAVPSGRRCCFPGHADRRTAPCWVQSNARERKRREADWDRAPEKYERGV